MSGALAVPHSLTPARSLRGAEAETRRAFEVMPQDWTDRLTAHGARIADGCVADFGDPGAERRAAVDGAVVADLGHLGVLAVAGGDRRAFLQGQLTADVAAIDAAHGGAGAWCTAKGRVAVLAHVLERDAELLLVMPRALVEPTLGRLRLFVLRADARLREASDETVRLGLAGDAAGDAVAAAAGSAPAAAGTVAGDADARALRLPGGHPRWLLVATADAARRAWDAALAAGAAPIGRAAWDLLAIEAGEPAIDAAVADAFLPQMLNLDRLGAVSFTKGCYVGQEVIARAQHLGRVKRRMYRARIAADEAPAPGTPVYGGDGEDTRAAGAVVVGAPHPDGTVHALVVVSDEAAGADLRAAHLLGPRVEIEPIDYADAAVPA